MKYFEFLEAIHNEALGVQLMWSDKGVTIVVRLWVHGYLVQRDCIVTKEMFHTSNFYLKDMIDDVVSRREEILNQFKNKNHGKDLQA